MRAPRRAQQTALGLLAVTIASGCGESTAGHHAARGPSKGGDTTVILDSAITTQGQGVALAWLAYGIAKMAAYKDHRPPSANTSADDFGLELIARQIQSEVWAKQKQEGKAVPNSDLDRQLEISQAGFLPELVVSIHSRPGWTVPKETILQLRLEEFAQRFNGRFSRARLATFVPPGGTDIPSVPGGDFPDPVDLAYAPESCDRALSAREDAWRRWAVLEPRLGGVPVSAATTVDFARQLIALKRDPAGLERGVTWVSARIGYLAQLDGFCAVEAKDWPRAQVTLARAVSLRPADATPRLELSLALLKLGHADEALKEADRVLASSDDGCAVARAWRRRGYILVDMGDLGAARAAYEQSLAVEAGNPLALSELAIIAKAAASPRAALVAPAAPAVLVTSCRPREAPPASAPASPVE